MGLGLTYTKLAEPTWDAVSEPPGSDTKVIRQTGSHARAGHVVLFVDYNWFALLHRRDPLPVEPVTQIGTSVSSTPGLFLGAGVQMFRVARLTGGWTWQRVPELNGQKAGDTVAGNDDIRTRDHFTGDWYIALTFALDWLPVFKK